MIALVALVFPDVHYREKKGCQYPIVVILGMQLVRRYQASFTPGASRFRYTLYGKNLTNKAYIQGALPSALAHEVIFGAPREVGVKVDWQF